MKVAMTAVKEKISKHLMSAADEENKYVKYVYPALPRFFSGIFVVVR
jgi:hypothetical protein